MTPGLHAANAPPRQVQGPREREEREERDRRAELKVHMKSGELYTLSKWKASADGTRVDGTGTRYSITREWGVTGPVSIPLSDVALFETSSPESVGTGGKAALVVMTTISGLLTGYCVADPKACFGSCPTFYLEHADPEGRPAAEGFSSSIARALEARDVDAIGSAAGNRRYTVTMRNEAFETHAVRRVRLLAAERPEAATVIAGPDGRFHAVAGAASPSSCLAPEGGCLAALAAEDGVERRSEPDARDLATRETVELEFAPRQGRVALVLVARQTLLSTQLFYQTLAYFGSRAGEYLATVERGGRDAAARTLGMARVLGGIEAEVSEDGGAWRPLGTFDEAGPIAGDRLALPFEARGGALRVRLRAAMGHYRIDRVALAVVVGEVEPRTLAPVAVRRNGRDDRSALERLTAGQSHLVTVPGDAYEIAFELPAAAGELELFLESEGYYYEWMREEWLAEENAELAALALLDPAGALKRMAGSIRRGERELEQAFWSSRFRR